MLDLFVRLQKRAKQLTIEIIDDKQADIKSDSSRCNDSEMLRSVGRSRRGKKAELNGETERVVNNKQVIHHQLKGMPVLTFIGQTRKTRRMIETPLNSRKTRRTEGAA